MLERDDAATVHFMVLVSAYKVVLLLVSALLGHDELLLVFGHLRQSDLVLEREIDGDVYLQFWLKVGNWISDCSLRDVLRCTS